jgi:glycosyltransferase involved in cell wall biosynthesis
VECERNKNIRATLFIGFLTPLISWGEYARLHDMVQQIGSRTVPRHTAFMLSAIISTRDSERSLVRTLAALAPAVTTGLLREAIVADGGSKDATAEVADIAGCVFQTSREPLGERLATAARGAKGPWLLFLPAGAVPAADWPEVVEQFLRVENEGRAAAFASGGSIGARIRAALAGPRPHQGLLIARRHYERFGGHQSGDNADRTLLRRAGRIAILPAKVTLRDT